jgi:MFS transporter, PPP family, 3-phenylpropionic acid transporter
MPTARNILPTQRTTNTLVPFGVFSAIYFAYAGLYSAYLPLYLKELGFATFAIALLSTVNNLTRCIGPYAWGWLGDHTGKRLLIVRVSCVVALLMCSILFAPPIMALFFVGLLAMNLATSSMTPLTESMMIARLHKADGKVDWGGYGRLRLWGSIGFAVCVTVSGWFFQHYSLAWFGGSIAVLLALLLLSSTQLPQDTAGLHIDKPPRVLPLLRSPVLAGFYVASFFMVAAHTGLYIFFSLYLDQLGYSKGTIGVLWALGVVFEVAWFYFQGHALKRIPLERLWVIACAIAALRFLLIGAFGQFILILVLTSASHFLTFAAHHTASMAFITKHFPGALANRGMALFTTVAYGFGGIAGGLVGGKVAQAFGYGAVFYTSTAFAVVALFASWWVVRHDALLSKENNDGDESQQASVLPTVS